jgi:DNA replication protein DnaC
MLREPTLQKLLAMKLSGMAAALEEQNQQPEIFSLSFEDRLAFLVEREWEERKSRKLKRRLHVAKIKQGGACQENMDYRTPRGLEKATLPSLSASKPANEGLGYYLRQLQDSSMSSKKPKVRNSCYVSRRPGHLLV